MGVVHRDIKPENILLDRHGRVKIADFGLAKLVGPTQPAERITVTGKAMGTPHYMAPEQWEKPLDVDHRADIYSLGVVLYEMLTGELPVGRFAPPSQKAGVDVRLDSVVLRAIEKQPEERFQKMSEMKDAVEATSQPSSQPPLSSLERIVSGVVAMIKGFTAIRRDDAAKAEDESDPPVPGLTAEEEQLRRLLSREEELSSYLAIIPEIDSSQLATARKRCRVAADDRILAVLDFSDGEGEAGLLFGSQALYWRNGEDTPHPGTGCLPYKDLAGRRVINHGDVVYLGKDQFLCPNPDETGIDCEELVNLLHKMPRE
jgi:serine/threonine protein kinase